MEAIITVSHVQKRFKQQVVLEDVSLNVTAGTIYALLGANGAGKSTLLKIMTGLLAGDQGQVTINQLPVTENLLQVQRLFSFSAQAATVDDVLSGYENLVLIARLRHVGQPKAAAKALLKQFDLLQAKDKRVADYSGGMRRRLDLAMSLVGDPEILFLDEPTTGLDPTSREALWRTIQTLKAQGKTIFLTTQYLEEADQLADNIGFLRDGQIVATGTPAAMKRLAGTDQLELLFATAALCQQAKLVLDEFKPKMVDTTGLSMPLTEMVQTTSAVLTALAAADCPPVTFKVVTPTLDDVFRKLTKAVS